MTDQPAEVSRRGFITSGTALLGAAAFGPMALLDACSRVGSSTATIHSTQQVTLKYGHVFVTPSSQTTIIQGFADRVNKLTNGNVTIQVYPASQLGTEAQMTQQAMLGALDIVGTNGSLQGTVPEFGLYYLPYLYKSFDHFLRVWTLRKSTTADKIAQIIEQKAKLKTLGYMATGLRDCCVRSRPVETLADFKGLKMRVDDAPTSAATFRALGAVPVPVAYTEVYQALQSGVIDAAENPPLNMLQLKWNEVTKYLSLTQHLMVLQTHAVNLDKWNSLPADYKGAIQQAMDEAVPQFNKFTGESRNKSIADAKSKGMTVNNVKDIASFQKATRPLIQDFVTKYSLDAEYKEIQKLQG